MLKLDNISLNVGEFSLKNISFEIQRGDYLVILGLSGVGKTLLLETIAGLQNYSSGTIYLRGNDISNHTIQERRISIVYQDVVLFPHLNVFENIAYPLRSKGTKDLKLRVEEAAAKTGIADKLERLPETLSGGEQQRAALARSIAAGSDIFLLDEPFSSIDLKSRNELRVLLRKLNREGITFVHVTHDYEEAISLANKIGIMERGILVHLDTPEEIFRHPKSEFVAHFTGVKNFLKGELTSPPGNDLKIFTSNGLEIFCLSESTDGEAFLMINPNDITISEEIQKGSERNRFRGRITDIVPARLGNEISVDIGKEFIALISTDALKSLHLEIGKDVWISFKASACKIYN